MTRRTVAAVAVVIVIGAGALARTGWSLGVLSDQRPGPPKSLSDTFLFTPPETPDAWAVRAKALRRQIQVALGL